MRQPKPIQATTLLTLLAIPLLATADCGGASGSFTCPDPINQYVLTNPPDPEHDGGEFGEGSCSVDCPPITTSPPEPMLDCIHEGLDYFCTAWPQGPALTYAWNGGPNVALEFERRSQLPQQRVSCLQLDEPARVELSIHTPWGLSSRRVFRFSCSLGGTVLPPPGGPIPAPEIPPVEETH